jgi:predicted O-methyltransferase YrrM
VSVRDWGAIAREACDKRRAQQVPAELTEVLQLLDERNASTIVEIGVGEGGTLWAWSQLPGPPVIVAISEPVPGPDWVKVPAGVRFMFVDSHTPEAVAFVTDQLLDAGCEGVADVVYIDGDHSYDGCSMDFAVYSRIVRKGGLVLVHDVRMMPGVIEWWDEIEASGRYKTRVIATAGPYDGNSGTGFGVIEIE